MLAGCFATMSGDNLGLAIRAGSREAMLECINPRFSTAKDVQGELGKVDGAADRGIVIMWRANTT
jgi:hypothetical protein